MAINAVLVGTRGTAAANTATTGGGATAASGSTFAAFVSYDATAGAITTAGDNKGNTYTGVGTAQADGFGGLGRWYVCENGLGGAGHTFTFTTASNHFGVVYLIEITGVPATPTDKNAQGSTSGASPWTTISTGTLSQADELILSACMVNNATSAAYVSDNGTILDQESSLSFWTSGIAKHIVASTTSYVPSWSKSGDSGLVGLCLVTFREGAISATIVAWLTA